MQQISTPELHTPEPMAQIDMSTNLESSDELCASFGPSEATMRFLRQFARCYQPLRGLPVSLGAVVVN